MKTPAYRLAANYGRLAAFHIREQNVREAKDVSTAYEVFVVQFPMNEWQQLDRWYYEAQGTVLRH